MRQSNKDFFSKYSEFKPEKTIKEEVLEIANESEQFNKILNKLKPTDEEYKVYGMSILISAHSYRSLENGDLLEKDSLLQRVVRSKDGEDILLEAVELATINDLSSKERTLSANLIQDMSNKVWDEKSGQLYADLDRKEFLKFMLESIENKDLYSNFILRGASRTGKSYLCSYLLNSLMRKKNVHDVAYISFNRFLSAWQMTFSDKTGVASKESKIIYDNLLTVKILILDDFGLGKIGEWAKSNVLVPLLTYRKANNLKTGIITPFSEGQLVNVLGGERKNSIQEARDQKLNSLLLDFKNFQLKKQH